MNTPWFHPVGLSAIVCSILTLFPGALTAQCPPATVSSAPPVPQIRAELPGESIWPLDAFGNIVFRPASATSPNRNSVDYDGTCSPTPTNGLELFQAVAGLEEYPSWLFVAHNGGLQIWDLRDDPANPSKMLTRDGFAEEFEYFPSVMPDPMVVETIDVFASGDAIFVAVGGGLGHGVSIWRFSISQETLTQIFQDASFEAGEVALFEHSDERIYLLAADRGVPTGGTRLFDVTSADTTPCFDDAMAPSACPSFEGFVGDMEQGRYLDVLVEDGQTYVVASDGFIDTPFSVEIWHLVDPSQPEASPTGASVQKFQGLDRDSRGVQLFELDGRPLLAAIEVLSVYTPTIEIFDVTACLDADGCTDLGERLLRFQMRPIGGNSQFLTLSKSGKRTFLYHGVDASILSGKRVERLLDITGLSPMGGGRVVEVTESGAEYPDPNNVNSLVDYWGDYYSFNTHGLPNVQPLKGIFLGNYFYRAGFGILDVHLYQPPADILIDGFESRDCSAWTEGSCS